MATTTTTKPVAEERDYPLPTKVVLYVDDMVSLKGDSLAGNINLGFEIASDKDVIAEREAQFEASLAYFKAKRIADMRKRK